LFEVGLYLLKYLRWLISNSYAIFNPLKNKVLFFEKVEFMDLGIFFLPFDGKKNLYILCLLG